MQRPKVPEMVVISLATVLLVGSVVGLTRTRDGGDGQPAGPSAVAIADFSFGPDALTVSVGDTVTWTNSDEATHTVTGREGETLKSPDLKTDEDYAVTFEAAGSFEYICKFHPNMQAIVTVED